MEENRMFKITTETGFECEIAADAMEDATNWKLLHVIYDDTKNGMVKDSAYDELMNRMLGRTQMQKLLQYAPKVHEYLRECADIFGQYSRAKKK